MSWTNSRLSSRLSKLEQTSPAECPECGATNGIPHPDTEPYIRMRVTHGPGAEPEPEEETPPCPTCGYGPIIIKVRGLEP